MSSNKLRAKGKNEALYKKLLAGKLDHLSPGEGQVIEPVLQKYELLFDDQDKRLQIHGCNRTQNHSYPCDTNKASPVQDPVRAAWRNGLSG
jgi:hypothetical protein